MNRDRGGAGFVPWWFVSGLLVLLAVSAAMAGGGKSIGTHLQPFPREGEPQYWTKVLVEMRVADYARLREASLAHPVRSPFHAAGRAAFSADAALARGIRKVADRVLAMLPKGSYRVHHRYATLPLLALEVTEFGRSVLEGLADVRSVVEDRPVPLPRDEGRIPPEGGSSFTPALLNSTVLIGAATAWEQGVTGAGWYVAVLDTGIRRTHEMFQGKELVEACFSSGGDCPGGVEEAFGPGSAAHYESFFAGYDHGTHVAGIAAGDNGKGLAGVARGAGLIAIQVFSRFYTCGDGNDPCVMSWTSDQIKALDYLYTLRNTYAVAAVNMSLGGGAYSDSGDCDLTNASIKTAIDNLRAVGIVTVIASGNDGYCGSISTPACISSALAVGATTKDDVEADFSNWEAVLLDLFAPGVSIFSSTGESDSSYAFWSGTSMAAPHVAGSFALLRQRYPRQEVDRLIQAVLDTGVPLATRCVGESATKPRIQVDAALKAAGTPNKTGIWLPSVLHILLYE